MLAFASRLVRGLSDMTVGTAIVLAHVALADRREPRLRYARGMDACQQLLDRLTRLRDSWPGAAWSWDARFAAVASTFAATDEAKARTSAIHAFPRGWTTASLDSAPATLRALADRTGGLRAGQRLLGGDELIAGGLFGLWWPWGSGDKITLRIGLAEPEAVADPIARVRELFGVRA